MSIPDVAPGLTVKGYRNVAAYKRHIAASMSPGEERERKEAEASAYEAAAVRICDHDWAWVVGVPEWNGAREQCRHCDLPKSAVSP